MSEASSKINIRQLAGDVLTIVFVGFLMIASLVASEYWLSGETINDSGNKKILATSR